MVKSERRKFAASAVVSPSTVSMVLLVSVGKRSVKSNCKFSVMDL